MYANLRVETSHGKILSAHEVEIRPEAIVVKLDDPDDESSYAAERGELHLHRNSKLCITADF